MNCITFDENSKTTIIVTDDLAYAIRRIADISAHFPNTIRVFKNGTFIHIKVPSRFGDKPTQASF